MQEIWKEIVPGKVSVSNSGNAINLNWRNTGKAMPFSKTNINTDNYIIIGYRLNGKKINEKLHRLVAKAFIPNPDNLPEINHKDKNKNNNSVDNLEWISSSNHLKLHNTGENNPMSKLSSDDVLSIKNSLTNIRGEGNRLSNEYKVSNATISLIKNGKLWKHVQP